MASFIDNNLLIASLLQTYIDVNVPMKFEAEEKM